MGIIDLKIGWLALAIVISLPFLIYVKYGNKLKIIKPFFLFLIIFTSVVLFNYGNNDIDPLIVSGHLSNILVLFSLYILGSEIDYSSDFFIKSSVVCFFVASTIIIYNQNFIINYWDFVVVSLNYQGLAMCYFILSLSIFLVKNKIFKYCLYLICLICFSIIGARTELISILFLILLFELFDRNRKYYILYMLSITTIFIFMLGITYFTSVFNFSQLSVIFNLEQDDSWKIRNEFLDRGLSIISENIFFGKYGSYKEGQYVHNILSAWVDLGLIPFLLLLFSLFKGFIFSIKNLFAEKSLNNILFMGISIIILVISVFSKQYTYPIIGFYLGLCSNFMLKTKLIKKTIVFK
mgnify:CR=1 FL=1